MNKPVLIYACGNPLAGDDALGPLVAGRLSQRFGREAEVICQPPVPGILVEKLQERRALLIVDALKVGDAAPGQIVDLNWFTRQRAQFASEALWSVHGWSVASELQLAQSLQLLPPQVRLLGINVAMVALGEPLGPAVAGAIPELHRRIARHIKALAHERSRGVVNHESQCMKGASYAHGHKN